MPTPADGLPTPCARCGGHAECMVTTRDALLCAACVGEDDVGDIVRVTERVPMKGAGILSRLRAYLLFSVTGFSMVFGLVTGVLLCSIPELFWMEPVERIVGTYAAFFILCFVVLIGVGELALRFDRPRMIEFSRGRILFWHGPGLTTVSDADCMWYEGKMRPIGLPPFECILIGFIPREGAKYMFDWCGREAPSRRVWEMVLRQSKARRLERNHMFAEVVLLFATQFSGMVAFFWVAKLTIERWGTLLSLTMSMAAAFALLVSILMIGHQLIFGEPMPFRPRRK